MNSLKFLLFPFMLSILLSCSESKREFPLYKMNESPLELVSVGGLLAECFFSSDSCRNEKEFEADTLNGQNKDLISLIEMTNSYATSGNEFLLRTCETVWDSIRYSNLFVDEKNIVPVDKERITQWLTLNSTLLRITADTKYADEFEKTVYNSFLGNCAKFNPEILSEKVAPNIYTRYLDQVYVNVFGNSSMQYEHTTGGKIRIIQDTKYPYDGLVKLKFETEDKRYVDLHIRIPKWAEKASVIVGGVKYKAVPGEYARVTKKWKTGDLVEIILPMKPRIKVNNDHFNLQYGVLEMSSRNFSSANENREGDPYQFLKFVSPPGKMPTFTFKGYQDTTLVFQPYFITGEKGSLRSTWFPWEN